MNEAEEMPEEVLLDAWYLTYGSKEVQFPLIRGADPSRIILSTPLMTSMWRTVMKKCRVRTTGLGTQAHLLLHYGAYAQYVRVVDGGIYTIQLRHKGA